MSSEERIIKFKRKVEALNKQFLEWVTAQIAQKPDCLLSTMAYQRHAAKISLEFSDIISSAEDEKSQDKSFYGRTYAPLLSLMPSCYTKTVHFIRHGEGWHNIGLANQDAQLTPRGWEQAVALGRHMQNYDITRNVQLVVVSPLMRALETAAGVFGIENTSTTNSSDHLLMVAQSDLPEVRTAQPARTIKRTGLKFLANELCRERLGPSSCDSRRKCSDAATAFPRVDFSLIDDDADPHWRPGNVEPEEAVVLRGRQFLQWLMSLPQSNIAVVTHSAFLWFTFATFATENIRPVKERLQRWYENCEMRSVVLSDGGSAAIIPALDSDYKGGHVVAELVEPQMALMEAEAEKEKKESENGGMKLGS